ncbi:biotin/lipoyl-containing protein [Oceanirhabdus sp. W0125-5]|uniref:biotin/lipoyl-containing protein n=1 Tax=Oceanirhabdus sp. W0125-5 TaxID=2999116 RepID=UPI0022F2C957|nr:biotin/lipoyl-containing protein [Oceanirhabdus sp. W0125-5]WBW97949.1 biotin/lipoyl-binding protein [Oceanirhabdus sp. W0125-5]
MKKYVVTVNGNRYEVEVDEVKGDFSSSAHVAAPVEKQVSPKPAATPKAAPKAGEKIEAPMPGTILKVNVKEGDSFKAGDVLFILEAMKMENEIKAQKDGKVVQVITSPSSQVNTGDALAVIE